MVTGAWCPGLPAASSFGRASPCSSRSVSSSGAPRSTRSTAIGSRACLAVQQDELALTNLAFAASEVDRIGGTVLIEPVSGAPRYPLLTAADALAVIDNVRADSGITNLGLLADLYHLAVNGDDVDAVIAGHADRIAHVQIADAPGRNEPGTGELPLDRQLAALEAADYAGWVGLEYKPSTTTVDSLEWLPRERRTAAADVTR